LRAQLPAAQVSKSQTSTEALLNGGMAKRGSSDIAAYRPRVSGTTVRKDMAYAQHLDNVHRSAALLCALPERHESWRML
jgi:hypothetical protein